jgi:long-chain acyl-CoA synthetase
MFCCSPEYLENVYTRSKYVAQCLVHGDSYHPYPIAVVIPDEEVLTAFAKQNKIEVYFE